MLQGNLRACLPDNWVSALRSGLVPHCRRSTPAHWVALLPG
jgi:hypothetical protein